MTLQEAEARVRNTAADIALVQEIQNSPALSVLFREDVHRQLNSNGAFRTVLTATLAEIFIRIGRELERADTLAKAERAS